MQAGSTLPAVLGLTCLVASASAEKMYWAHSSVGDHRIQRANLDGSNVEDVRSNLGLAGGVAVDHAERKLYWLGADTETSFVGLHRVNLDGTEIENLIDLKPSFTSALALDLENGKVYWTTPDAGKTDEGAIGRANLDGTNVEQLYTSKRSIHGLALDTLRGKMYWTEETHGAGGRILRANLDGSGVETLILSPTPRGIALDVSGGKMYWNDLDAGFHRANFDGTNVVRLDLPAGWPTLDLDTGTIYLSDRAIFRADLNGDNLTTLIPLTTAQACCSAIALDPGPPPIPAASAWTLAILTLLLLITATTVLVRRRVAVRA